ncbi:DUF1272 domain-containing protein [Psychroserpens burtonensis]|nr:DUF1272 domain-containing protein [Psychroserpens burtonensis]
MKCAFCDNCVTLLKEACPNCGDGFKKRPIRPQSVLKKYPVSKKLVHKPIYIEAHINRIRNI